MKKEGCADGGWGGEGRRAGRTGDTSVANPERSVHKAELERRNSLPEKEDLRKRTSQPTHEGKAKEVETGAGKRGGRGNWRR